MATLTRSPDRLRSLSTLAGLGIALYTIENLLPSPIPWIRLGTSNLAILLALYRFGLGGAGWVLGVKVVLGALLVGRLLSPFFLFALAGGTASLGVMATARSLFSPRLTITGVSMLGGVSHNLAQLTVAYLLWLPHRELLFSIPILVLLGLGTGGLVGLLSAMVLERLKRKEARCLEEEHLP